MAESCSMDYGLYDQDHSKYTTPKIRIPRGAGRFGKAALSTFTTN